MTYREFAQQRGVGIDAVRIARAVVLPGQRFKRDAEIPENELPLLANVGSGSRRPRTVSNGGPAPRLSEVVPAAAMPEPTKPPRNWEALAVLLASTVVTIASVVLTNFELVSLANYFGLALGIGFAAYLFLTVVVARNRMKGDTSARALKTLLICEGLAGVLHTFNFYRQLTDEIPNESARLAAALMLAVFMVFVSFESVLALRNFNGEVPDENPEAQ